MKIIRLNPKDKKWKIKRLKDGLVYYERIGEKFIRIKTIN
jgi:hypothetical protein